MSKPVKQPDPSGPDSGLALLAARASAIVGGAIALSAVVGLIFVVRAAMGADATAQTFYVVMFEPVVLLAGVLAVLVGTRKIKEGRALTLMICGAAVAILAVLSDTSIPSKIYGANAPSAVIGGVEIQPFAIARLFSGFVILALSGLFALGRSGRAGMPMMVRGFLLGIPVVIGMGAGVFLLTARGRAMIDGIPNPIVAIGLVIGALIVGGFVSASAHYWIRAFEVGAGDVVPEGEQASDSKAA